MDHIFVDESKRRGLVVVAARFSPNQLSEARSAMRSLTMPRQRRVHFKTEGDARKRKILDVVAELRPTAIAYSCSDAATELGARQSCLQRIVEEHADCSRLILETDESVVNHDKRSLFAAVRKMQSELRYDHLRGHEEPLLWVPDAVAWAWTAGGQWRRRVGSFTEQRNIVP